MNFREITQEYYSCWLGKKDILKNTDSRLSFVYSEERNRIQNGYSDVFDIWGICTAEQTFISFGQKAQEKITNLRNAISSTSSLKEICQKITEIYGKAPSQGVKYLYSGGSDVSSVAVILRHSDYEHYLTFFKTINPKCKNTEWLKEYFDEMVDVEMCCGIMQDEKLVCCTDLPAMPYMQDCVQEIGINTLVDYRGRGYASDACLLCIDQVLASEKCPLWSTSANNGASQKLAEKIGFVKFGDFITLTL